MSCTLIVKNISDAESFQRLKNSVMNGGAVPSEWILINPPEEADLSNLPLVQVIIDEHSDYTLLNKAVQKASYEYVVIVDSCYTVHRSFLDRMQIYLECLPSVISADLCTSRVSSNHYQRLKNRKSPDSNMEKCFEPRYFDRSGFCTNKELFLNLGGFQGANAEIAEQRFIKSALQKGVAFYLSDAKLLKQRRGRRYSHQPFSRGSLTDNEAFT